MPDFMPGDLFLIPLRFYFPCTKIHFWSWSNNLFHYFASEHILLLKE